MQRYSAHRYLVLSVRLRREEANSLLDEAERTGRADHLWDEAHRRPGATDVQATATYDASKGDQGWEVHRPGFSHGMHYNYLDDIHPTECTECYCRHHRYSHVQVLAKDRPSSCQCGHLTTHHRYRVIRDVIDVCRAPETWFTQDMATFNALAALGG